MDNKFDIRWDDDKIHITYLDDVYSECVIYIDDITSNLMMHRFNVDFSKAKSYWCSPSNVVSLDTLDKFRGFNISIKDDTTEIHNEELIIHNVNDIDGCKFQYPTNEILWINHYEHFYRNDYDTFIDFKDSIVVDIGASIGVFSRCALSKGAKKCYSIEPLSYIQTMLQNNLGLSDNIVYSTNAIGTETKSGYMLTEKVGWSYAYGLSVLVDDIPNVFEGKIEKTNTFTLQDYMTHHNIKHIDVLKIDIEGLEVSLFNSWDDNFIKSNIKQFIIDVDHNYEDRNEVIEPMLNRLNRNGFICKTLRSPIKNGGSIIMAVKQ